MIAAQAREARDAALVRVIDRSPEFKIRVQEFIASLPGGWQGTAEDIRLLYEQSPGPTPGHHNAWGSVVMAAIKRGALEKTGERRYMKDRKAHGRDTPVYRRTR